MKRIDKEKILRPQVHFSQEALRQIELRVKFEKETEGKVFRIHIDGKGCDGFTYGAFFTDLDPEDFSYEFKLPSTEMTFQTAVEPFTAFYAQNITIDYHFDPQTEDEGFIINVKNSQDFSGKFFNNDEPHLPPELTL